MLFKRGNAARDAVDLEEGRPSKSVVGSKTMSLAVSAFLAAASIVAIPPAHAGYITSDVGIWRLWRQYGTTNPFFETVQEAFADTQARSPCTNPATQTCVFYENLRPDPDPNQLYWSYNGVPYRWVADKRICTGGNCTLFVANTAFIQDARCPVWGDRSYALTQLNWSNPPPYDRQVVCRMNIPETEPCSDCYARGNPIHPGTGQKVQRELDYASPSGVLEFARTYRSNIGNFASPATSIWVDNTVANVALPGCVPNFAEGLPHCHEYLTTGTQTYRLETPDGRMIGFSGPPGAITAKADINDRVSQQTNPSTGAIEWVIRRGDDSTEIYNTQGRLIRKTSLTGRDDITYTYSGGRLTSMSDRVGRTLAFTYDAKGRLSTMTDPAGGLFQYGYEDLKNRLTSVTYPDGLVRTYLYNEAANINNGSACGGNPEAFPWLLTGISDNGQRLSTYKYNCSKKALSTELAGGVNKYSYTYPGGAVEVDPLGTTRTLNFAEFVSVIKPYSTIQPAASGTGTVSESMWYNANGSLSQRTDFNGNRTNFTYDLSRNLETQRKEGLTSGGANTPQTRTINTQWHASFRLPIKIAEPLRITTFVYNGDAGASCGSRADGSLVPGVLCSKTVQATTDANGSLGFSATLAGTPRAWSYTYNANGSMLTVDGPRTDVSDVTTYTYYADDDADLGKRGNVATITNALGHRVDITDYNAHGQPTRIVDANAMVTMLAYDARQRLTSRNVGGEVTSYDYDALGQLERVTLPDGSYLNYGYDTARRLNEISDNLGNRIAYTLDNAGNRTAEEVRDPANVLAQKRTRVYNALNRLFKDLGAQNQTTEYAYDNNGNVTSVKDPLNHITTNQYDALHRLVQVTDPASGITKYEYNGLDSLTKVTDPRNLATNYTVDGLGNLTLQASPDTGNTASTFDAAGNPFTRTDAKGQITTYAYDSLYRVTSATFHDSSKHVFSYDSGTNGVGRLTGVTELNPAQAVIASTAYAYDAKGRVTSDTRTISGVAYTTGYRYDSFGRLDRITYPSGRTVDYSFDNLGRVSAVTTTPSGGTASSVASAITYHPFGGVKSYILGNGQSYVRSYDQDGRIDSYTLGATTLSIGYDAASRIGFITEVGNPASSNSYGYDVLDRLTSADTPGTDYLYGYDGVGNRLSKTAGAGTANYVYSTTSNRLATITPTSGPVRSFTFDLNGSTTADGTNTYAYDVRGRMIQSVGGLGTTSYHINALGQRVRKTNAFTDTVFHYDVKGHLLAESAAAGTMAREFVWLGGTPLAVIASTNSNFIHVDHLDTPRLVANAAGTTVWKWDQQEPFGNNVADENPSGLGAFDLPLRLPVTCPHS